VLPVCKGDKTSGILNYWSDSEEMSYSSSSLIVVK
jgi:hypothetical protein